MITMEAAAAVVAVVAAATGVLTTTQTTAGKKDKGARRTSVQLIIGLLFGTATLSSFVCLFSTLVWVCWQLAAVLFPPVCCLGFSLRSSNILGNMHRTVTGCPIKLG